MAEQEKHLDFGAGAARVANMLQVAADAGMDMPTFQKAVRAYMDQLAQWREAGSPGEPPSGFALVGEFLHKQGQGEAHGK